MQQTGVIAPTSTEITLPPSKDSSDQEYKASSKSAGSKMSTDGDCVHVQQGDYNPADQLMSMRSEETVMNDSFDNENVCKQKAHKKDKQWINLNTLEEPLLQD